MIPASLLGVQPSHRCLDLCASPGSKTTQLLEVAPSSQKPQSRLLEPVQASGLVGHKAVESLKGRRLSVAGSVLQGGDRWAGTGGSRSFGRQGFWRHRGGGGQRFQPRPRLSVGERLLKLGSLPKPRDLAFRWQLLVCLIARNLLTSFHLEPAAGAEMRRPWPCNEPPAHRGSQCSAVSKHSASDDLQPGEKVGCRDQVRPSGLTRQATWWQARLLSSPGGRPLSRVYVAQQLAILPDAPGRESTHTDG